MGHRISVAQRRARLAARHHLAPAAAADGVVALAGSLVGLHATDPTTPYLSARARRSGFEVSELEAALYDEHRLVKHLCMRRTLFVVADDLLPVVHAAASEAVAAKERRRLVADLERGGVTRDGTKCTTFEECKGLIADGEDIDYDGPSGPQEFSQPGEPTAASFLIQTYGDDNKIDHSLDEFRQASF